MKKALLILAVLMTAFGIYGQSLAISAFDAEMAIENEFVHWLSWCESRHNDQAINPKDSDGTPSWGRFQFKLKTLKTFSVLYGLLKDTDNAWDYRFGSFLQESIVRRMWQDKKTEDNPKGVDLSRQFPDCWRKYLRGETPKW